MILFKKLECKTILTNLFKTINKYFLRFLIYIGRIKGIIMSVEAVNSINNNVKINKTSDLPAKEKAEPEQKKNGTALLLGSLAALAIGGGIYLATRGKGGNESIKTGAEAISETPKPIEQVKEMAIDAFKKAGNKFEKGKAKLANGENYTGILTHTRKDGTTLVMEYDNGLLKESTIHDNYSILSGKNYTYDSNNQLKEVNDLFGDMHKSLRIKRDEATGKILNNGHQDFIYSSEDGSLRYIGNIKLFEGQYGTVEGFAELYPHSNKIKRAVSYPVGGSVYHFDEKGNVIQFGRERFAPGNQYEHNWINNSNYTLKDGYETDYYGKERYRVLKMLRHEKDHYGSELFFGENKIYITNKLRGKAKRCLTITNYRKGDSVLEIGKDKCAKYNIHTKELEILPDSKHSKEEILEIINGLTEDAKLMMSKRKEIRSFEQPSKEFNQIVKQLVSSGSGVNKHFV